MNSLVRVVELYFTKETVHFMFLKIIYKEKHLDFSNNCHWVNSRSFFWQSLWVSKWRCFLDGSQITTEIAFSKSTTKYLLSCHIMHSLSVGLNKGEKFVAFDPNRCCRFIQRSWIYYIWVFGCTELYLNNGYTILDLWLGKYPYWI